MSINDDLFGNLFAPGTYQDPKARLLLDIVCKAPEVKLRELRDIANAMGFNVAIQLSKKEEEK